MHWWGRAKSDESGNGPGRRGGTTPRAWQRFMARFGGRTGYKSTLRGHEAPLRPIPYAFGALILVGALFLRLPLAHNPGRSISSLDALFLSTSATCVTGLSPVNVAEVFNGFGQAVLLVLIQAGGIGIMTAGTFFLVLTGNRLSLAHEQSIAGAFGQLRSVRPGDIFAYACVVVLVTELAGAVALFSLISQQWPEQPVGTALWQAAFHSVSAFCNAGISIFPEGLARWKNVPALLGVVDALVITGGIGLLTLVNLRYYRWWRRDSRKRGSLSVQTRLSVAITVLLLAGGTLLTLALEWNRTLAAAHSFGERLSWAFFHSTMTRTAGFSVVDLAQMHPATLQISIVLMFIGGAPGSMAGGIKTSTTAVLVLAAWAALRRRSEVNLFGRRVPGGQTSAAVMILLLATASLLLAVILLMITEGGSLAVHARHGWLGVVFEAVSAFGTVGLSADVTPLLTSSGKAIIIALMFLGRVGPLMLAMHLCRPVVPWHVRYPEESISLG
jgi:trk system potassium uptake protein TrkH